MHHLEAQFSAHGAMDSGFPAFRGLIGLREGFREAPRALFEALRGLLRVTFSAIQAFGRPFAMEIRFEVRYSEVRRGGVR